MGLAMACSTAVGLLRKLSMALCRCRPNRWRTKPGRFAVTCHGQVSSPVRLARFVALQAEYAGHRLSRCFLFEYIGLAGADMAHIVCGIRIPVIRAKASAYAAYTRTAWSQDVLMRTAVTARFGEWRLLVDVIQRIS